MDAPRESARGTLLRSMAAVALGFLVLGGLAIATDAALRLAGLFPDAAAMSTPLLALAVSYRMLFTVAGGFVTAHLAPAKPLVHAVVLGFVSSVIVLVGSAAVARQAPGSTPVWYPMAILAATMPCAGLGGLLRLQREPLRQPPPMT